MKNEEKLFELVKFIGERVEKEIHVEEFSIDGVEVYRVYTQRSQVFEIKYSFQESINKISHDFISWKKEDGFDEMSLDDALDYVENYCKHVYNTMNKYTLTSDGKAYNISDVFVEKLYKTSLLLDYKKKLILNHISLTPVVSMEVK